MQSLQWCLDLLSTYWMLWSSQHLQETTTHKSPTYFNTNLKIQDVLWQDKNEYATKSENITVWFKQIERERTKLKVSRFFASSNCLKSFLPGSSRLWCFLSRFLRFPCVLKVLKNRQATQPRFQISLTIYSEQTKTFTTRNSQAQMINSSDTCTAIHLKTK